MLVVKVVGLSCSPDGHHPTYVVLAILVMSVAYGYICSSDRLLVPIDSPNRLVVTSGY